jgi:uncharacterized membrane protein
METETRVSPRVRQFVMLVDRMAIGISRHWLALVNVVLLVFSGLPVLAPVLMHYGYTGPAQAIYSVYRLTCHELAYRSFFLFGAQPAYALDQLSAANGTPGSDLGYWGDFVGNSQLGFKMAWCERDAAIYAAIIVAGLLFGLLRPRLPRLDLRLFILVFVVPMAIDGFWQLFTSPNYYLPFLPAHESTWWLRLITGALFGAGSVWLAYPFVEEAMRDVYAQSSAQLQRAIAHGGRVLAVPLVLTQG